MMHLRSLRVLTVGAALGFGLVGLPQSSRAACACGDALLDEILAAVRVHGHAARNPADPGRQPRPGLRGRRPGPQSPEVVPPRELTDADVDAVMKFIGEHFTGWHKHLLHSRSEDKRAFRRILNPVAPRMFGLMETLERNPKLGKLRIEEAKLQHKVFRMLKRLDRATDAKTRLRHQTELRALIRQQFDVEQAAYKEEIADLERRLAEQRACHQRRLNDKKDIVSRRLERALRSADERQPKRNGSSEPR